MDTSENDEVPQDMDSDDIDMALAELFDDGDAKIAKEDVLGIAEEPHVDTAAASGEAAHVLAAELPDPVLEVLRSTRWGAYRIIPKQVWHL